MEDGTERFGEARFTDRVVQAVLLQSTGLVSTERDLVGSDEPSDDIRGGAVPSTRREWVAQRSTRRDEQDVDVTEKFGPCQTGFQEDCDGRSVRTQPADEMPDLGPGAVMVRSHGSFIDETQCPLTSFEGRHQYVDRVQPLKLVDSGQLRTCVMDVIWRSLYYSHSMSSRLPSL